MRTVLISYQTDASAWLPIGIKQAVSSKLYQAVSNSYQSYYSMVPTML